MRTCIKCGASKPLADYYRNGEHRRTDCKACVLEERRLRYEADPAFRQRIKALAEERIVAEGPEVRRQRLAAFRQTERGRAMTRRNHLKQTYGMTVDDFDRMLDAQGGCCAVCNSADPGRSWCVDHDHVSGMVRGVLCWHCNVALGHFRDDVQSLAAAILYIERSLHRAQSEVA